MTNPSLHPDDWIDLWVADELDEAKARQLEAHWQACARCRQLRDALRATRQALRGMPANDSVPAGFEERLAAALDAEDRTARARSSQGSSARTEVMLRRRGVARYLLPLAAALAVVVGIGWWLGARGSQGRAGREVLDDAFTTYRDLVASGMPAQASTSDPSEVEARWRRAGIDFSARVLDLGAMGIELAGGDASRLGGRIAARTYYQGAAGRFICWMFESSSSSLPPPEEIRRHRDFVFRIYRRGEVTLVIWQEGPVACAFAGRGDSESVIALAFAKAMAPPAAPAAPTG